MIAVRSAPPKHVSYTQDSCRRCCAAEGLPGRATRRPDFRIRGAPASTVRVSVAVGSEEALNVSLSIVQ
jgi:hypothetical protein